MSFIPTFSDRYGRQMTLDQGASHENAPGEERKANLRFAEGPQVPSCKQQRHYQASATLGVAHMPG